ncbi:MAG TPA: hypothetical protein VNQ90_07000 [Chthoniobacteraceae bacterium]|nr:hypothetical protein [Chthoniobacteraceae bacterium]
MSQTLQISVFEADVTPPLGHPLCAGWYPPAIGVTDPLKALGIILLPPDALPIVICAVDWSEISNRSHVAWRQALAQAAGTLPERVAVHCTHAHNTPWPDEVANELMEKAGGPPIMDARWCSAALTRVAEAARASLPHARAVSRVGVGEAVVRGIASNRRIPGPGGEVRAVRWTVTRDPEVRAEPEGVIDPLLRTIRFDSPTGPIAVLHFYTTHPTSFDGDGLVTNEFCGLARERRREQQPGVMHLYLTGCAGNITAGKYNEGNSASRVHFTEVLEAAMAEAENSSREVDFSTLAWSHLPVVLPPRPDDREEAPWAALEDRALRFKRRSQAALRLAYLQRLDEPIQFGCLRVGDEAMLLFLPGEAFVEYQLFAQQLKPGAWMAVAAYGDCGPGYIPLARSFYEGGYEPTDAFVSPEAEPVMRRAIETLVNAPVTP